MAHPHAVSCCARCAGAGKGAAPPTQKAEAGLQARASRLQQASGASSSHSSLRARFNLEAFRPGAGQSRRASTG